MTTRAFGTWRHESDYHVDCTQGGHHKDDHDGTPKWYKNLSHSFWVNSVGISNHAGRVVAGTFFHDYTKPGSEPNTKGTFGTSCYDGKQPSLANRAKCVGLIGALLSDLVGYTVADQRYGESLRLVMDMMPRSRRACRSKTGWRRRKPWGG
jgi:hypothetical protein